MNSDYLSEFECSKLLKYTRIVTNAVYVIEIYYGSFHIGNEVCSFYNTFKRDIQTIPLHYGLWKIIACGVF